MKIKSRSTLFVFWTHSATAWLFFICTLFPQSCQPGSGKASFSIAQDKSPDSSGNVVLLVNHKPSQITVWDYGFGKSYQKSDTIRYALAGTYEITFTSISGGDTLGPFSEKINVKHNRFQYINNSLWDDLSGGYGLKKSWVLDMDQAYFKSPLYFAGTDIGWNQQDAYGCIGNECWWWVPTFEKEPWIMERVDHGRMTFSLSDSAYLAVEKEAEGKTVSGTFMLDTAKKILFTHRTFPLHSPNWENNVSNWSRSQIITLNEYFLQLAFLRDQNNTEKQVQLVFNYISEEFYKKQQKIKEQENSRNPNPGFSLTQDLMIETLAGKPGQSKTWELDQDWPIDWTDHQGKGWTRNVLSVWGWAWNEDCVEETRNARITFSNRGGTLYFTLNQLSQTCSSVVDLNPDRKELTIKECPLIELKDSWLTTQAPTWKWLKGSPVFIKRDGIWLGIRTKPDEYLAYHLILKK